MTSTATPSQILEESTVTSCLECPLARHLEGDRYACGNSSGVAFGKHQATAECREAISFYPERHFQPLPLPDLKGLEPAQVCGHIRLNLNFLDVHDEYSAPDGDVIINVDHKGVHVGNLRSSEFYYSKRFPEVQSSDPYWVALHLIHPDFLYGIADEILLQRQEMPDYD